MEQCEPGCHTGFSGQDRGVVSLRWLHKRIKTDQSLCPKTEMGSHPSSRHPAGGSSYREIQPYGVAPNVHLSLQGAPITHQQQSQ